MVDELCPKLLEISQEIQRLKNSIHTLQIAAQKAWANKAEKIRLKSLQAELLNCTEQADALWQILSSKKPLELKKILLDLEQELVQFWDEFRSKTPIPDSPQGEYNSSILPLIIADLKQMSEGQEPSHDRYWVLGIAQKLIQQQQP